MKSGIRCATICLSLIVLASGCKKEVVDDFWETQIPETDTLVTSSQVTGYIFKPAIVPATDQNIAQLKVPAGFTVKKFADNLHKPRILVISPSGKIYASDRDAGTVTMLSDDNLDGVADSKKIVATLDQAHGLAIYNGRMYITTVKEVYMADINVDGTLGPLSMIITNLPDGGQHPNRTLAFGPDGKMYLTVGSTCNSCPEPNTMNATIVRANDDGSNVAIYAKGLRNTIGFGWHPQTSEMWGLDHGIDWLGDDDQKEEVNQIKQDGNYGWPYIYGEGKYNPEDRPEGDTTYEQYSLLTTQPALTYQAHSAPMQMAFYTGTKFPAEYQNDAFVTMRGSWNRSKPVGYKVVRLHFENGKPVRFDDFLTGFLVNSNNATFGRLVGLAVHPDGSLYVGDDENGVIYRISN